MQHHLDVPEYLLLQIHQVEQGETPIYVMTWNSTPFTAVHLLAYFPPSFSGTCAWKVLKKQIICGRLFVRQQSSATNTADTKWMSNEALYGPALAWQGGFFGLLDEAARNGALCTEEFPQLLHTIASCSRETHCGPAATVAILTNAFVHRV